MYSKCPACNKEHKFTKQEINKLNTTKECSYVCECGSHIKIIDVKGE